MRTIFAILAIIFLIPINSASAEEPPTEEASTVLPETGPTLERFKTMYKEQRLRYSDDRFVVEHARCVADEHCTVDPTHGEFVTADGYLFVDLIVGERREHLLWNHRIRKDQLREVMSEPEWENQKHLLRTIHSWFDYPPPQRRRS